MDFLSQKVAYYRYPSYALFHFDQMEQKLEILGYHSDRKSAIEAQRQHFRQFFIAWVFTENFNTLDRILTLLTDEKFNQEQCDLEKFWINIADQTGISIEPLGDPTYTHVIRHENLIYHLYDYIEDGKGYKVFIPDMDFIFDQINLEPQQECELLSQCINESTNVNYHIIKLPSGCPAN